MSIAYDGNEAVAATGILGEPAADQAPTAHRQRRADPSAGAETLSVALNPSSIAIIGASDNPNKIGGRPLLFLSRFGYRGRVYPINPNRAEVQGIRTFPDARSLPEAPELVIVAAPASEVAAAVDDCAAVGARVAIVMASGYGETSDTSAIAAQRAMVERARAAGMRLVGPNSQGLANFGTGAIASFSTMFLEVPPKDGPVAIIGQSGSMSTAPYGLLRANGIGVRHVHATGNDADVTLSELALAVIQDPEVRLLLLYIESIRDADTLARVAAVARERDVPVVAIKAGRTARGQAAARSHTGALLNEDRVVDAFFKRHGIWRARDMHELVAAAGAYLKGWRPKSNRLVVVSNSGASCVLAADSAPELKLDLAPLGATTLNTLTEQLPSFATATNPIDITAALLTDSALFARILSLLKVDENVDLVLAALPVVGAGYDIPAFVSAAAEFTALPDKAIVVTTALESAAAKFRAGGVVTIANQSEALTVLAQVAHHAALLRRKAPVDRAPLDCIELPSGDSRYVDEAASLRCLRGCGMATVQWRVCHREEDATSAYREFGAPVVVKACSAAVPHKSEFGLVILNVRDEAAAAAAFLSIRRRMHELDVEGSVLIAPMIENRRELFLGAKVDPIFGPMIMVGDGGRYVEALDDTALVLAPATEEEIRDALLSLRIAPILRGARGEPPYDLAALSAAAVRVSHVIASARDQIVSIDLNPVMLGRHTEGAVIVDALIERRLHAAP